MNGERIEQLAGTLQDKLQPLFMLASLTLEAYGNVVDSALPMKLELAEYVLDLKHEFGLIHGDLLLEAHQIQEQASRDPVIQAVPRQAPR